MATYKFGILKEKIEDEIITTIINEGDKKYIKSLKKDISDSDILKKLYLVYENIDKCKLQDRSSIEVFINENLSIFKKYTKKDINESCRYLSEKINYNSDNEDLLYDVILESTKYSNIKNFENKAKKINTIVTKILNKKSVSDSVNEEELSLDECKKQLADISEKYSFLNESEYEILQAFLHKDEEKKKTIFERLKRDNINHLKRTIFQTPDNEEPLPIINEAIDKINNMIYNEETSVKDFVKLLELIN